MVSEVEPTGWALTYGVPIVLSCLAYVNSLRGELVHDDLSAIRDNEDVVAPPGSDISALWSHDFWGMSLSDANSHKSYRPLTVLSFR